MLLSRDYVGYMAGEVVKRLLAAKMIEAPSPATLAQRVRVAMQDEISVEDRLNEEVRDILTKHAEEMRRTGVQYQVMYKKVKGELARKRNLILRSRRCGGAFFSATVIVRPWGSLAATAIGKLIRDKMVVFLFW